MSLPRGIELAGWLGASLRKEVRMHAIIASAHGAHQVRLGQRPTPRDPGPGQVILKITAVGVCGSDLHIYHGTESFPMRYPVALGHEMTGNIVAMGDDVTGFAVGDRVVSETAYAVCGTCLLCRQGHYNLCPERLGFGALVDGGMAEYLVTRAAIVHRVPDAVDPVAAAMTEPTAVAFHGLTVNATLTPGDTVVVIGPGPVGLMATQVARLYSPRQLVVLGTVADAPRLTLAQQLGATDVYDDAGMAISALESSGFGVGVDVVIDASGITGTLKTALALVRPGGQIVKIGWGPEIPTFGLDTLVAKAVTLRGSFSHHWETWERVLSLMATGQLQPRAISQVYPWEDWNRAFEEMATHQIGKAVLTL